MIEIEHVRVGKRAREKTRLLQTVRSNKVVVEHMLGNIEMNMNKTLAGETRDQGQKDNKWQPIMRARYLNRAEAFFPMFF